MTPWEGETVIPKSLPSGFDRTELHEFLQARGITTLALAGLMTHMCVETTARAAVPLGYAVIVAADACASRDLPAIFIDGRDGDGAELALVGEEHDFPQLFVIPDDDTA